MRSGARERDSTEASERHTQRRRGQRRRQAGKRASRQANDSRLALSSVTIILTFEISRHGEETESVGGRMSIKVQRDKMDGWMDVWMDGWT